MPCHSLYPADFSLCFSSVPRSLSVCLSALFPSCCVISLFCHSPSLFLCSFGFSETHKMGRAAAYLISQHARGSIVNHLGLLTVTHQHISKQGHYTCTHLLHNKWLGRDPPHTLLSKPYLHKLYYCIFWHTNCWGLTNLYFSESYRICIKEPRKVTEIQRHSIFL